MLAQHLSLASNERILAQLERVDAFPAVRHAHLDDLSVRPEHDIAMAVKRRLKEEGPGIVDVMVHVEPRKAQIDSRLPRQRNRMFPRVGKKR